MKYISSFTVVLIALILVFPLYWMFTGSLKGVLANVQQPPQLIPHKPTLEHYIMLSIFPVAKWTLNSFIVSGSAALLTTLTTATAAYAIQIKKFKGAEAIFWIFLAAMMIPSHITLIPLFVIIKKLHLFNTLPAMIFPKMHSVVYIFFFREYLKSFPTELLDVADMDGATERRKFFNILLPLTTPALAAIATFTFMAVWGDFLWQLLVASKKAIRTLPVGIVEIVSRSTEAMAMQGLPNHGLRMAGATIAFLPMLIFFLFCQKYFKKGLFIGALKQ
ncbi:carbohydrate ABC transporter permease [Candidatus Pacearchaeota archaeon]|nr:carbohydrate ABC transporter permease [Candidatus Pacearchaeota archaeon]